MPIRVIAVYYMSDLIGTQSRFTEVFKTCNQDIHIGFYVQCQAMSNSAELLPKLVNNGVRLMAYAGNTGASVRVIARSPEWMVKPQILDAVCNYMVG